MKTNGWSGDDRSLSGTQVSGTISLLAGAALAVAVLLTTFGHGMSRAQPLATAAGYVPTRTNTPLVRVYLPLVVTGLAEPPPATPTPSPAPPTATATAAPPTSTPTASYTVTATRTPTITNTPTATATATASGTATQTGTPTATRTRTPTRTVTPTASVAVLRISDLLPCDNPQIVRIANIGGAAQGMTGWRIHSTQGNEWFTFPVGFILPAGSRVEVLSGPAAVDNPPAQLLWFTRLVWGGYGDTAELYDQWGALVDFHPFWDICPQPE